MNLIDIVLGVILAIAFYIGFKKGFFVALASLIALIAGIIGAIYFSDYAAGMISERFEWSPLTINIVAFAVTFLGIVFTISLMGKGTYQNRRFCHVRLCEQTLWRHL